MENQPNGRVLTEHEYADVLAAKDARRDANFSIMSAVNETLISEQRTTGGEIFPGWKDINSYFPYPTNGDNRILHVRISPVDGSRKIRISMRELDREKMLDERKRVSFGSETQSQLRILLEPTLIPGTKSSILKVLKKELPKPKI